MYFGALSLESYTSAIDLPTILYVAIDLPTILYVGIDLPTVLYVAIDLPTVLYVGIDLPTVLYVLHIDWNLANSHEQRMLLIN